MTLTFPADADVVGGLGGARGNFRAGCISSARPLLVGVVSPVQL